MPLPAEERDGDVSFAKAPGHSGAALAVDTSRGVGPPCPLDCLADTAHRHRSAARFSMAFEVSGRSSAVNVALRTVSVYSSAVLLLALSPAESFAQSGVKENLDLPFDALGENEEEEDAPEVVNFYTVTLEGDGFFYIIDRSGTMATMRASSPGQGRRSRRTSTSSRTASSSGSSFSAPTSPSSPRTASPPRRTWP